MQVQRSIEICRCFGEMQIFESPSQHLKTWKLYFSFAEMSLVKNHLGSLPLTVLIFCAHNLVSIHDNSTPASTLGMVQTSTHECESFEYKENKKLLYETNSIELTNLVAKSECHSGCINFPFCLNFFPCNLFLVIIFVSVHTFSVVNSINSFVCCNELTASQLERSLWN